MCASISPFDDTMGSFLASRMNLPPTHAHLSLRAAVVAQSALSHRTCRLDRAKRDRGNSRDHGTGRSIQEAPVLAPLPAHFLTHDVAADPILPPSEPPRQDAAEQMVRGHHGTREAQDRVRSTQVRSNGWSRPACCAGLLSCACHNRLITTRSSRFTNFVEVRFRSARARCGAAPVRACVGAHWRLHLAVQELQDRVSAVCGPVFHSLCRRSSTWDSVLQPRHVVLTLLLRGQDNDLSYLEGIHLFVELLDRYFGNVTELDLVYNFHKVYVTMDEYVLAGEIQETSQTVMLERLQLLERVW